MTDLQLGNTKILIKSENVAEIIKCFNEKFDDCKKADTIEDVFWEFGYNIITDDDNNISDIDNTSDDLPDGQEEFFKAIAPFVENGSCIYLSREDKYWKFLFEDGKVRRIDSEIVYYDKPMTYDRVMFLINELIEYLCEVERIREVIEELLLVGFTVDELIDVFRFDKDDIDIVLESMEE